MRSSFWRLATCIEQICRSEHVSVHITSFRNMHWFCACDCSGLHLQHSCIKSLVIPVMPACVARWVDVLTPTAFCHVQKTRVQQSARNIANIAMSFFESNTEAWNDPWIRIASNSKRKDVSRRRLSYCENDFCHPIAWDLGNPFCRPDKVVSSASENWNDYLGSDDAETAMCVMWEFPATLREALQ